MSEWISVNDRLPENDDSVFIYPGVELANWHQIAEYDPWVRKCFVITEYDIYDSNEFQHKCVTHWMPLPEPPNTGE